MTNNELQNFLAQYPNDMPIRFLADHNEGSNTPILEFTTENIMLTSETAYVDEDAPEDEWDTEDGKVELGDGQQFLLINPIIM